MTENPISDMVFQYQFENTHFSRDVIWNAPGDVDTYCDRTAETYQRLVLYHEQLNENDKTIFSTLIGFCLGFDDIPHNLEIQELYPMLCKIETVMKTTFNEIGERSSKKQQVTA